MQTAEVNKCSIQTETNRSGPAEYVKNASGGPRKKKCAAILILIHVQISHAGMTGAANGRVTIDLRSRL